MIAYLDCSTGVSGDLWLSALLDAGFSVASLEKALVAVSCDEVLFAVEAVSEGGRRSVQLSFRSSELPPARTFAEWTAHVDTVSLSAPIRAQTVACLHTLATAIAVVSGNALAESVVTAQAFAEIFGVVVGMDALGIENLYASPLPLTSGLIETAVGMQAVPAPVTLEILRRVHAPWQVSPLGGELVTPVAAALLATLADFHPPLLAIEHVSYGRGAEQLGWPFPLRLCLSQRQDEPSSEPSPHAESTGAETDWVAVIESHLDTMTGELLGGLMERLFASGALDVTYTPIQMKKNRPATLLTVICPPALGEPLSLLLLRETTTLGVRIQHIRRLKAQREQVSIDTVLGIVLVKVKRLGRQIISVAPEYEECQRLARTQHLPLADVYEVVRDAIKNAIIV